MKNFCGCFFDEKTKNHVFLDHFEPKNPKMARFFAPIPQKPENNSRTPLKPPRNPEKRQKQPLLTPKYQLGGKAG